MHINLVLGACVAGLQLVAANAAPEHHNNHDKVRWVTEIRARPPFPSGNWGDGWGPVGGQPEHHPKGSKHHKGSKLAHGDDNKKHGKHHKHEKSKHAKPTPDSMPNKEHEQGHHSKNHKGKHHDDKPSKSKQHHAEHTKGRTQTSAAPPTYSGGMGGSYQQQTIENHNVHRKNHSAPMITWSDSLAATAAKIAADCNFAHVMVSKIDTPIPVSDIC